MTSNAIESTESVASSASAGAVSPSEVAATQLETFAADLAAGPLKKQLQAVQALAAMGEAGDRKLVDALKAALTGADSGTVLTAAEGSAYQMLHKADSAIAQAFIAAHPNGLLETPSAQDVVYQPLQMLLVRQDYQAADKLTTQLLCELAGESASKRKWVYFTEVSQLPAVDLQTIDRLWRLYSEDKFGWSKQRELWLRLGQDWDRLWTQLLWKSDEGIWTRYPTEFTWDLSAPMGHLPLSNQLRGVRVMDSLLSHPAWES